MNLKLGLLFCTTIWAALLLSCSNPSSGSGSSSVSDVEAGSDIGGVLPDSVDESKYILTALTYPQSSTRLDGFWTEKETLAHKLEAYQMALTPKHWKWQNPTTGGAVHINSAGQVEVYQFTLGMMYKGHQGDSAVLVEFVKEDTALVVPVNEIIHHVGGIGEGNATSVLLTSEIPPLDARVFPEVLEVLYRPGIQLYYLQEESSTPLDEMSK